jgi:hypothetical protein
MAKPPSLRPSRPLRRCNLPQRRCRDSSFRVVPTFESEPASSRNFGEHAVVFRDAVGVLWADALLLHIGLKTPSERLPVDDNENEPSAVLLAFTLPISPCAPLQSSSAQMRREFVSTIGRPDHGYCRIRNICKVTLSPPYYTRAKQQ